MKVICVNNDNNSKLELGKVYKVKYKYDCSNSINIIGVGVCTTNRFTKLDGTSIDFNDKYCDYRYNPFMASVYGFDITKIKYIKLKPTSKIKSLKFNHFYKIHSIDFFNHKVKPVLSSRQKIKMKATIFNIEHFLYYTEEEYSRFMLKYKLLKLKEKSTKQENKLLKLMQKLIKQN